VIRRIAAGVCGFAVLLGGAGHAEAQERSSPCAVVRDHARDTVIVFQAPSTFTICRGGSVESDVVTGRPVYLQLTPSPGSRMFDFRVHGQSSAWTPTGLSSWEELTARIAGGLRDLQHSSEPISALVVPLDPPAGSSPLRALATARAQYVGDVTPKYLDALHAVHGDVRELPVIASVARRWCTELETATLLSPAIEADLKGRCAGPEVREGAMEHDVQAFDTAATAFGKERDRAREATVTAVARSDDAAAVAEAIKALESARHAAMTVVSVAHALRESTEALSRDLAELRLVRRSLDAIRAETPMYLSTYGSAGNAELEIDATPVDLAETGLATAHAATGKTTARFPIVGRHYIDIEAGLGLTGFLPAIPYVESVKDVATIQGKPVDEFVGLALVELEPARFVWPDRPLAGLLRFPVLGVPFTRDPTQNFFAGGGVGWTGVGSIVVGPYLLRELTVRDGLAIGDALPAGTTIGAATQPGLRVGSFVSASVDLLGLLHLFLPAHVSAIDAATGKEK
jgi:hypothetical protein